MKKLVVGIIFTLFIASVGLSFIAYNQILTPPSEDPTEVVFEVPPGKIFKVIAHELQEQGIVKNGTLFSLYARVLHEAGKMKVGEYSLRRNMTPNEVLAVITSGKSIARNFTISEGLNIFEISENYEKAGFGKRADFLALCLDKTFIKQQLGEEHESLEGYLFPETYQLTKYTSTQELLQTMTRRFSAVYAELSPQSEIKGLDRHQIMTLASIIEKETGAPEERPLISSIFHNRLKKGMLLQTDPTIIYGMAEQTQKTEIKISKEDILRPTRYNTYVIKGLPPGPIANPGREAILAAMKPANSEYLFFVSQNNGTHVFSKDYASHEKAVQKFQVDAKARAGKSWRDLKKDKK